MGPEGCRCLWLNPESSLTPTGRLRYRPAWLAHLGGGPSLEGEGQRFSPSPLVGCAGSLEGSHPPHLPETALGDFPRGPWASLVGLTPGSGEIPPSSRKWQPTPVFLPGESHGQKSLVGYSLWGHKESDTTERLILWVEWLRICRAVQGTWVPSLAGKGDPTYLRAARPTVQLESSRATPREA